MIFTSISEYIVVNNSGKIYRTGLDDMKFRSKITVFRECLQEAESNPDNSPGNKQAIVNSYNYSVEMEERVATRFNEAVRDYKARKAAAEG